MSEVKVGAAKVAKAQEVATPAPTPELKSKLIRAVYGRMIHPYTGQVFETHKGTEVWNEDSWVVVQLDAEKLEYADS